MFILKAVFIKNYLAKPYGAKNSYNSVLQFSAVRYANFCCIWLYQVILLKMTFKNLCPENRGLFDCSVLMFDIVKFGYFCNASGGGIYLRSPIKAKKFTFRNDIQSNELI